MRWILLFVLALASVGASAQSVYKCIGKGGAVSFQSEPCADAGQVEKTWDATPERLSNAEQWQRYNAQQKAANDAAYLRRLAGGRPAQSGASVVVVPRQSNLCSNARKSRDNFYANHPRRTSKDMERWNKHVYDACK